jgi:hypothetical protein
MSDIQKPVFSSQNIVNQMNNAYRFAIFLPYKMMIFYPFPPGREKDRTSISTRRVLLNPAGLELGKQVFKRVLEF